MSEEELARLRDTLRASVDRSQALLRNAEVLLAAAQRPRDASEPDSPNSSQIVKTETKT
jgi:hypothetical protein